MDQNETISVLDWMSGLPDNRLLSSLSIPGTHNSCALYDFFPIPPNNAKCQTLHLDEQLQAGVRCLDIRLKLENGILKACHGEGFFCADQKITFDEIIKICSEFLKEHKGESILMFIKKEDGDDIGDSIRKKIDQNPNLWYISDSTPALGAVRGKIVLLRRFSFNGTLGIKLCDGWRNNDPYFSISIPNGTFYIQDKYHPEGKKEEAQNGKWDAVKNMFNKCNSDSNEAHWYVNYTSGYYMVDYLFKEIPNTRTIADFVNPKVKDFLEKSVLKRCGVLGMDFVEKSDPKVQKIISLNY